MGSERDKINKMHSSLKDGDDRGERLVYNPASRKICTSRGSADPDDALVATPEDLDLFAA